MLVYNSEQQLLSTMKSSIDAIQHSLEKGLTLMTYLEDGAVCIRISDTAEGIYKGRLERIF